MSFRQTRNTGAVIAIAVVLSLVMPLQAVSGFSPSVSVEAVNGQPVVDGTVELSEKAKHIFADGTAAVIRSLVADAGDSQVTAVGEPLRQTGFALGGAAPYTFAWSFNGSTDRFDDPASPSAVFDTSGLQPGPVALSLTVTDSSGRTAVDEVRHSLDDVREVVLDVTGEVDSGLPDETPGDFAMASGVPVSTSGVADGASIRHDFDVPSGSTSLTVDLTWNKPANDIDMRVDDPSDREDANAAGATGNEGSERIKVDDPAAGSWAALVQPYDSTPDTYRVVATTEGQVNDPRPTIDTPPVFAFTLGDEQELAATVAGGTAPLTTGWDLDGDGRFERPGTTVSADLPLGTHLVTAKVTDGAGFERRSTIGVRITAEEEPASAIVVVAVTDTGINPYHDDFGAALYPDRTILELTDNFRRHPSEYLPGYPSSAKAVPISLGRGYLPPQDEPLFARANIGLHELVWFPGTKVIGAIDGGDTDATDTRPILDEHGHGTGSASVAVGNVFGYCPTCLLVANEDINGDINWPYGQPWIDIVTNSYGTRSNIGSVGNNIPFIDLEEVPKASAERGQLALFAAGNGNENGFVTPEQTYTSDLSGPDWVLRVGAAMRDSGKPIIGTGKPVDLTSYGDGYIPSAAKDGTSTEQDTHLHGGTSAASPYTSGVFGSVLGSARRALGDTEAGQKPAAGPGVIATGEPVIASPYLRDGNLTLAEMQDVVLKTAEHDDTDTLTFGPTTTPSNAAQFAVEGYGIANKDSAARAIDVLLGRRPVPDRTPEDAFFAADSALRESIWGDWSGGGANDAGATSGANTTFAGPLNPFAGTSASSIATFSDALSLLEEQAGPFTPPIRLAADAAAAEADTISYWLHRTACGGGVNYMDLSNTEGDHDRCIILGAGLPIAAAQTYPSTDPSSVTIPQDTPVSGSIFVRTTEPALLSASVTLLANGVAIGQARTDAVISFGVGDDLIAFWNELPFEFRTGEGVAPGQPLTLSVSFDTSATVIVGYEGDHASGFRLVGVSGGGGGGGGGEGDPNALNDSGATDALQVTVSSPTSGSTIDTAETPTLSAAGSALFPPSAGLEGRTRFYPHWPDNGSGGCGDPYLSREASIGGAETSCRYTLEAINSLGLGEQRVPLTNITQDGQMQEQYPLVEQDLPLTLDAAPVTGSLFYNWGNTARTPLQRVTVKLVGVHRGLVETIGSVTVEGHTVSYDPLAELSRFDFQIDLPEAARGRVYTELRLDLVPDRVIDQSLERPKSFVDMSVGTPSDEVQLSIDDPTFVSPVGATLGADGTWGADLTIADLAPGAHTLYARAVRGTVRSQAVEVDLTITRTEGSALVEVQLVRQGEALSDTGWHPATDTSGDDTWSSWFAYLGKIKKNDGDHILHARLLHNGTEIRAPEVRLTR